MGSSLPTKEQSAFKSVVKLYETKNYKKAVKVADGILKKFPKHGETLSMKGLALNSLDRRVEAFELANLGIINDPRSHVTWHVLGLMHRADRNYRAAAKAYKQALKNDRDNIQILRDLALLEIQIRDYEGYRATRLQLLKLKPTQNNWIGFAVAHHLAKDHEAALAVLDAYDKTMGSAAGDAEEAFEASELALYKNWIIEESGNYEKARIHLDEMKPRVLDRISWRESRARLLILLKDREEAIDECRTLLKINPDNGAYYRMLLEASVLTSDSDSENRDFRSIQLSLCDDIAEISDGSLSSLRIPLDILDGDSPEFSQRLDRYVRYFLDKGIPSLFSDLKPLYEDHTKVTAIGWLFESFLTHLEEGGSLPAGGHANSNGPTVTEKDASSPLLWVLHFLAQHYDRTLAFEKACATVEKAMEIDPNLVELYLVKAKILYHLGDRLGAVHVANEARMMDLADRYLNSKCAKYAIRADMVEQGEAWISLFTRDAESGGIQALYDMQCMWYELEAGESFLRQGKLAQALKRFTAVERHFGDIVEDQFDFHTYCLRKVTLRSYVQLLRMEDSLYLHVYFRRAAKGLLRVLLQLDDLKSAVKSDSLSEQLARLTMLRSRKIGGPEPEEGGITNLASKESSPGASGSVRKGKANARRQPGWMEIDADGMELIGAIKAPLTDAAKYVAILSPFNLYDPEIEYLFFEVSLRRKKYLLALRSLRRSHQRDPYCWMTIAMQVKLARSLSNGELDSKSGEVNEAFRMVSRPLLDGVANLSKFLMNYLDKVREDHLRSFVTGELLYLYARESPSSREQGKELMLSLGYPTVSIKSCEFALGRLQDLDLGEEVISTFMEACHKRFPSANSFGGGVVVQRSLPGGGSI
uniref:Uncharacterized protein n=1 Tax=Compsopogon caeruleus TaxID=31354 RepID=A0A7S1TFR3_9RHOD|mmetsp:Transcript_5035/g.10188  ORF Transcript_5035/g.10188 Transcript_5035/m.10188 type:complete len:872 (+) Transcript_5035:168-2783(+)